MSRLICALFAALCLTGCGAGEAVPGSETPQGTQPAETGAARSEGPAGSSQARGAESGQEDPKLKITVGDNELPATFEDNSSADEFRELLAQGPVTVEMEDYGGFEKVGPLGAALTRNDTRITTEPGDVILYQGDQITIYYGVNTWNFTRLARIDDPAGLQEKLGPGTVAVTFSLGQ